MTSSTSPKSARTSAAPTHSYGENDRFGGSDRNYTNGVRFSWLSGTQATDNFSDLIADYILGADEGAVVRRGFAIGQSIFTPEDIDETAPLPDQQPYAGWLYGEVTALIEQRNVVDQVSVQIGVVGQSAAGETAQNEFHALIGAEPARGWDNQIDDEIGLVVAYDKKLRRLFKLGDTQFGADVTPNIGFAAGNVHTNARAGFTLRAGQDLQNDFGPPRVRPSLGGAGYFTPRDQFSWYAFAGVEGRAVAHNIFLDGSLFREDDPSVERKTWVTDLQAGLVAQYHGTQVAFTFVERSEEFAQQNGSQQFGAFSISQKF